MLDVKEECIFCKLANHEEKRDIVYENDNFVAFPDAHPVVEGHTLIVPKKHFVNLVDMPESLSVEMIDVVKKLFEIKSKEGIEGFNIVSNNFPAAGQIVLHAHLHFFPRKSGDGKKLGFE